MTRSAPVSLRMHVRDEGHVYSYTSDAAAQEATLRAIARHNPELYVAVLVAVLAERPEQVRNSRTSPLLTASPKGTVVH